jgi:hypothetical protein
MTASDLQAILDNAVTNGIPGLTGVAVDRSGITFQGDYANVTSR